jgi:hypothetical protein
MYCIATKLHLIIFFVFFVMVPVGNIHVLHLRLAFDQAIWPICVCVCVCVSVCLC